MSEGTWLGQTKKRYNAWWITLIIAAAVTAAGIFFHNNSDILWGRKVLHNEAGKETVAPDSAKSGSLPLVAAATSRTIAAKKLLPDEEKSVDTANLRQISAAATSPSDQGGAAGEKTSSKMALGEITCRMADKKRPALLLSLELRFDDDPGFARELLLKRDNLKVMVRKVMSSKLPEDLVVEKLKPELKDALNGILEKGKIADIEFNEFRIDKVE